VTHTGREARMTIPARAAALSAALVTLTTAGAAIAAATGSGRANGAEAGRTGGAVVRLADARLKFEINATDGDGGIQVFLDGESWRRMSIFDPAGRRILTTMTEGRMGRQGGTELFLESSEPTFAQLSLARLLARFPAGTYTFRGTGLKDERYVGTARLTHDLPDAPKLVSPLEGDAPQDPGRTTLRWTGVKAPNGSPIIGYQVLVVQPETGLRSLPTRTLDVMMPPTARRLVVPRGFLRRGTEYEWEVLAIEHGGNQTLSAGTFRTSK
jgi:hypothetical protein